MNILFVLAGDKTRASSRYRVLNFLPALTDVGIQHNTISADKYEDVIPGPNSIGYGLFTFELLLRARQYDVLFLQKVPLPALILKVLLKIYDKIIYDFDDALYAAPQWEGQESQWKSLLDQTLQHSSLILTGNPVLSDYARQFTDTIVCLPTTLPAKAYRAKMEQEYNPDHGTVTLGWIGNPQNLHYLTLIEATLEKILDTNDTVEFHVITAGDLPTTPLQDRDDVTYKTWTLEDELDLLADIDIGLRPLFDDEWTRGKGGYTSVVQMMALGIPVVVTPVGMLSEIVEHDRTGYHATTDEEWIEYLSTLIDDQQKRTEFGRAGHDAVGEQRFWTEQRVDEWIQIFERL